MIKIFMKKKIMVIKLIVLFMWACSGDSGENSGSGPTEPTVIIPENLSLNIEISGSENNATGDGSGEITCTANADNAISYSFFFGNGDIVDSDNGQVTYAYEEGGTNEYTVKVIAYSKTNHSTNKSQKITIYVNPELELVWSDEFNTDGSPDSSKWTYDLGTGCPNICGWGNNESQYYTNRSDNVSVSNGTLKINLKKENYAGSDFTSTRMKTKGKYEFTYGKIEVRAKLPSGGGTWPAIWMLGANIDEVGWPACGEIDIMEHVGNDQNKVHHSIHTPSSHGATQNTSSEYFSNVSSSFKVYAVLWTKDKLEFSVDGEIKYTYNPGIKDNSTWPFDKDQFILLNIAMGGTFGGQIDESFLQNLRWK